MQPSLPQNASDPEKRKKEIEKRKDTYQFDYSYEDLPFAKKVPIKDFFTAKAMAKIMDNKMAFYENWGKWKVSSGLGTDKEKPSKALFSKLMKKGEQKIKAFFGDTKPYLDTVNDRRINTIEDFKQMWQSLKPPPCYELYDEDWYFAWQRVAGTTPSILLGVTEIPSHFAVTNEIYQRAVGKNDSLEKALAERRLFMLDYGYMKDLQSQTAEGLNKTVYAPLALFTRLPERAHMGFDLVPVCIQLYQDPHPDYPIRTPQDGLWWTLAKAAVQSADGYVHGTIEHLTACHLVAEAITLATLRTLPESHPLMVLLAMHLEWTLAANIETKHLILPDKEIQTLQAPTMESTFTFMRNYLRNYPISHPSPPHNFRENNTDDRDALPMYPFRDDGVLIWDAILPFVDQYVRLYYQNEADVAADFELQDWARELHATDGARLGNIGNEGRLETVEQVVDVTAWIIYLLAPYHTVYNYTGYEQLSFPPNMCYGAFDAVPPDSENPNENNLYTMFPPIKTAFQQLNLVHTQQALYENRLGKWPEGWFTDERVPPLVNSFNARLDEIEAIINERNKIRPLPFKHLLPSMITASVHI